ncbi:hypothetical protein NDU88_000578 [Pleurodeles waltl]|uniref:Receptor ligand binding region domain-containing protein n=1 Tax=Pleurodeles waltl TaxID=8319 RepID=A0AAV7KR36_PLEWA|nr:hypothetical protein NDU88_000578 [Pleurodeles waltl]
MQAYGLARLVNHFGWTWVGILSQEGDYGRLSSQIFKEEIVKAGVCVAFSEIIPAINSKIKIDQIVEVITRSSAKVIAILSVDVYASLFMEELATIDVTERLWLATEAPSVPNKNVVRAVHGTLGLVNHNGEMPGFEDFFFNLKPSWFPNDPYIKNFWDETFHCQWAQDPGNQSIVKSNKEITHTTCSGTENLRDVEVYSNINDLRVTYNVYKSTYAAAHALHNMLSCRPEEGPFVNGSCARIHDYKSWQVGLIRKKQQTDGLHSLGKDYRGCTYSLSV